MVAVPNKLLKETVVEMLFHELIGFTKTGKLFINIKIT